MPNSVDSVVNKTDKFSVPSELTVVTINKVNKLENKITSGI